MYVPEETHTFWVESLSLYLLEWHETSTWRAFLLVGVSTGGVAPSV